MTSIPSQRLAQFALDQPVTTPVPAAPVRQEFYVKSPLLEAKAARLSAANQRMDDELRRRNIVKAVESERSLQEEESTQVGHRQESGEQQAEMAETARVAEEERAAAYSRAAEDYVFYTLKQNLRDELAAAGVPEHAIDENRFEGSPLDGAVRAVMPVGTTITTKNFHEMAQRAVARTDAALDRALPKIDRETIVAKREALADAPDALTAVEIKTAVDAEGVERASKSTATLSASGLSRFASKMAVSQAAVVTVGVVLPGLAVAGASAGTP